MLLDLAPDKGAVEQHVRAVRRMHRWTVRLQRLFGIRRTAAAHRSTAPLGGVFGQRAAVGNHRATHSPA
jgi:hypothetical protein